MDRALSRRTLGWAAVAVSTAIASFWAFWGIIENFHEGWYQPSLVDRLAMMFGQYLSVPLVFVALACVSIRWPRIGGALHALVGLVAIWFFRGASSSVVLVSIAAPFMVLAFLYGFGGPEPKRLACLAAAGLPTITILFAGAGPALRVARRLDAVDLGARVVEGNGVRLVWAPDGPGWPQQGVDWAEAVRRCRCLEEDGKRLAAAPRDLWRLPTIDEVARSMTLHGENAGGAWDPAAAQATYRVTPDKGSPLWNVHSKIIYWWTSSEVDEHRAWMFVYDGRAWAREKKIGPGYLGYRCVRAAG